MTDYQIATIFTVLIADSLMLCWLFAKSFIPPKEKMHTCPFSGFVKCSEWDCRNCCIAKTKIYKGDK